MKKETLLAMVEGAFGETSIDDATRLSILNRLKTELIAPEGEPLVYVEKSDLQQSVHVFLALQEGEIALKQASKLPSPRPNKWASSNEGTVIEPRSSATRKR